MNLIRFKSVFIICWLLLVLKYNQVKSTTPLILMDKDVYCGLSDAKKDRCSTYCYKSVKPPLAYIIELKKKIMAMSEEHLERYNDIRQLRQKFLDLSDYRDHIKALNQQIEELRKTNEILRESNQHRNYTEKTEEDMKLKEKDLYECIANRDNLKKEIEVERNTRIEIENSYKLDLENLKREKKRIISDFEIKSIKELADQKTKEELLNNEIKRINSQVSSYKKLLEESQNQLTDKNHLVESNSLKIKTIERDLAECKENFPKTGCKGLLSGIQKIELAGLHPFSALCNGDIECGGWIVIQKRFDGSEDFYRNWTDYRNGFGKLEGEFFIGLELLHRITNSRRYELYIQMEYFNGTVENARYDNFIIGNENEKYKIKSIGEFSGTAPNLLHLHLGKKFSTFDQNNNEKKNSNCAKNLHSGWWHSCVYGAHLNGIYCKNGITMFNCMFWVPKKPLKSLNLLIRPFN